MDKNKLKMLIAFTHGVVGELFQFVFIHLLPHNQKTGADTGRSLTVPTVVDAAVGSTLCLNSLALIQRCFEVEQYIV